MHYYTCILYRLIDDRSGTQQYEAREYTHRHTLTLQKKRPKRTNDYEYFREIVFNFSYSFYVFFVRIN